MTEKPDPYTCEETFRRLDDYVDRALTPQELEQVREHLDRCAWCASEFKFEASILNSVREKLARLEAPPDLLSRISRALTEAESERS